MKIMYVPGYLRVALEAAGLTKACDYTLQNLVNILSPTDVAFYLFANGNLQRYLPGGIASSFETNAFDCLDINVASYSELLAYKDTKVIDEVITVLNDYQLNDSIPRKEEEVFLTCHLMDENVVYFTDEVRVTEALDIVIEERQLLDRVIQQLHGAMAFEEIAALPLFAGYLAATQAILKKPALVA